MPIRGIENRRSKSEEILKAPIGEDANGFFVDHPEGLEARIDFRNSAWVASYGGEIIAVVDTPQEAFSRVLNEKVLDVLGEPEPGDVPPPVMPSPEKQLKNRFAGLTREQIKVAGNYTEEEVEQVLAVMQGA